MAKEIYLDIVLQQVPRLLGLLDRNPLSRTYGCFDRQYWHYHVVDFPAARYQEACLTLALLYQIKHRKNPYYQNRLILKWIRASLDFWRKMQRRDGSFDEWYPYEHSYVATAFSLYAISEVMLLLPQFQTQELLGAVRKAADFLAEQKETRVQNQMSGAAVALYNVYLLASNEKYHKASFRTLHQLSKLQSGEGWFMEYGGADAGYLSLAIDYLMKLYDKSKDMHPIAMAVNAARFIYQTMHPDGTFGGDYGSRNTEYIIPSGIEMLATQEAETLAMVLRKSIASQTTITPASLDDRYLAYITYTYLQAYQHARENIRFKLPEASRYYPGAGIAIIRNKFFLISNLKKGGSFRAIFKNDSIYDAGIQVQTRKRKLFSGYMHNARAACAGQVIKVEGNLQEITDTKMKPWKMILLHLFQSTLGRSRFFSKTIKNFLRDVLIQRKNSSEIRYTREINAEELLTVTDTIYSLPASRIILNTKSSYASVPSSRYFQPAELFAFPVEVELKKRATVRIVRRYSMHGRLIGAPEVRAS